VAAFADGESATEDQPLVLVDMESVVRRAEVGDAPRGGAVPPIAMEMRWLRLASYFRPDTDPCLTPAAVSAREFFGPLPRL
ncbi:unnamed protein product, partial [Polarella glacialis]